MLLRRYHIGPYTLMILPLLMLPSWALAFAYCLLPIAYAYRGGLSGPSTWAGAMGPAHGMTIGKCEEA